MSLYSLYIFDRHCQCIFHVNLAEQSQKENRLRIQTEQQQEQPESPIKTKAATTRTVPWEEQAKLVYGVVFSLLNMANKLKTKQSNEGVLNYKTSTYQLHSIKTFSRLTFVLMADASKEKSAQGLSWRDVLLQIYDKIYVEYAAKNPMYKMGDSLMTNEVFKSRLMEFIQAQ